MCRYRFSTGLAALVALATVASLASPARAQIYSPAIREVTEWRTANSKHYQRADGTFTAEIHLAPIHYKAPDDTWQPIDTKLHAATRSGYAASNETNVLKSHLPATASGWVRVEADGVAVSFRPLGASNASASIATDTATMNGAWPSTTVSYTVEPGRLKELITLNSPQAPKVFRHLLSLEGLKAEKSEDGSVNLVGNDGKTRLLIPPPWMKDAKDTVSYDIAVGLENTAEGLEYSLTPNPEWLATAVYPIALDPTVALPALGLVGWASYDNPTAAIAATPSYWVGVTGTNQAGARRSLLQFNASSLPLDIDIYGATINLWQTGALTPGIGVTIEARHYPVLGNPPGSAIWSEDPARTDLRVGRDLSPYGRGKPKMFFGGSSHTGIDATAPVARWAENRSIWNGTTYVALPLNIVLRDITDGPGSHPVSGNCIQFNVSYLSLSVNYRIEGWNTFQGNRQRTGFTQYPVSSTPGQQWWAALLTDSGSPLSGDLHPSIVAVPNSNDPSSGLPVIYAAVTDGGSTRLYRIEDQGTTRTISHTQIGSFAVTGTPLVLSGTSGANPDRVFLTGLGTGVNDRRVIVYRFDALTNGGTTIWTQIWERIFPNCQFLAREMAASPLYWHGPTDYQLQTIDGPMPQRNWDGAVIIAMNDRDYTGYFPLSTGYLRALSVTNGHNVWGLVDSNGDLIPAVPAGGSNPTPGGLVPMQSPSSHGSPSLTYQDEVVVADMQGYMNYRNVVTGAPSKVPIRPAGSPGGIVQSSPSVFDGRLFYGETWNFFASMTETGDHPIGMNPLYGTWTTGAVSPEHQVVLFGAEDAWYTGWVIAIDAEISTADGFVTEKWANPIVFGRVRSSPLVAGAPGSGHAVAFVGSDDHYLRCLNPADGTVLNTIGPLNGLIRASMAAYQGRLYVLSGGSDWSSWPILYCFE
jgi:hypothetical protein